MYRFLASAFLFAILGLPLVAAAEAARLAPLGSWSLLLWPPVYVVAYVLVAGGLALPFRSSIVPGRFRRDLSDPAYRRRRLYGLCWTSVYYFTPLYHVCLSIPPLKRLLFRMFGYRGSMDFTVYPDTWIRDLPLLDFGPGAYLSNRATIGTNVALMNGTLLVDRVTVGPRGMVGHLAMVSTGVVLEEGAEVGVGCAIGSKVMLRKGADVAPCCAVGHLAEIGAGTRVGFMSWVGAGSRLGENLVLPPHASIPNRARVPDAAAAAGYLSSALGSLESLSARLARGEDAPACVAIDPAREAVLARDEAGSRAVRPPRTDGGAPLPAAQTPREAAARSSPDSGIFKAEWNRFE